MGNTVGLHEIAGLPGSVAGAAEATTPPIPVLAAAEEQPPLELAAESGPDLSTFEGLVVRAQAGPEVRLDRIAALEQAISAGTYCVPAHVVAEKMMESFLTE